MNVSILAKRLLLLLFGLVAACLIAEVVIRLSHYDAVNLMAKDPLLGQKYKAGITMKIFEPEAKRHVEIRTNSLGFRDEEHSFNRSVRNRILFLGDSFTAGFAVEWESTFPQVTAQTLNATEDKWEVITMAVAGFGTAQEMVAYREMGSKFNPKFIIIGFFAGNDVSDNSSELSSNPRVYFSLDQSGKLFQQPRSEIRSKTSGWLNENSRLYLWQKQQFRKVENFYKNRLQINPAHRVFLEKYDQKMIRAWEITFALVREVNDMATRNGSKLIICYIPFSDEVNPDWWKETVNASPPMQNEKWDLQKPERMMSEFCTKNHIAFHSPREYFLQQSLKGNRFYFPHGHFNERGHREFGNLIAKWIDEAQQN